MGSSRLISWYTCVLSTYDSDPCGLSFLCKFDRLGPRTSVFLPLTEFTVFEQEGGPSERHYSSLCTMVRDWTIVKSFVPAIPQSVPIVHVGVLLTSVEIWSF